MLRGSMKSPRSRRPALVAALAVAAGMSGVLYAQAVNLKPGKYEFTSTVDMQLPPDVAARLGPNAVAMMQQPHVMQQCISQPDLEHVSKNLSQGHNDQGCTITDRSVSGNEVSFTMQCPNGRTTHFEGTFMSDSFKAVMTTTGPQGPMKVNIAARRLAECGK
jgi:Protein of unknown function (DUF3617)